MRKDKQMKSVKRETYKYKYKSFNLRTNEVEGDMKKGEKVI